MDGVVGDDSHLLHIRLTVFSQELFVAEDVDDFGNQIIASLRFVNLLLDATFQRHGDNLSILGLPKYSYGTAVICNYGKEGLEDTFLPLFPFSYSPICVGISKIKEYNPFKYEDKKINDDKKYYKCKFYYTIDHRFLNERIVAKLLNDINSTILNPKQVFDQVYFSECSDISSTEIQPVSKIKMHFENQMKKNKNYLNIFNIIIII